VADAVRRALLVVLAAVGGVELLLVLSVLFPLPQAARVSARTRTIGEKREYKSFMDDVLLVV